MTIPAIDGYLVDVFVSESPDLPAEITDYPVEEGSDVSDNIRNLPVQLRVEGVISDTPIGILAELREGLPANEAYELLKEIRESRRLVTVETSRDVYKNMALENLSLSDTAETGDALQFSATFKQVITVSNNREVLRTLEPRGRRKAGLGNRPALAQENFRFDLTGAGLGSPNVTQPWDGGYVFQFEDRKDPIAEHYEPPPPAKRARRSPGEEFAKGNASLYDLATGNF